MPRKKDYSSHINPASAPRCEMPDCAEPGCYKAPRSRQDLRDYRWLCLEHVREHNAKWDYFEGLDPGEIEHFMKDAVTGHRPTWEREALIRDQYRKLQEALYDFVSASHKPMPNLPPLSTPLRKAVAVLELAYPFSEQELKAHYRILVKKHHPDLNPDDKQAEENFKRIAVAYQLLLEHLKNLG